MYTRPIASLSTLLVAALALTACSGAEGDEPAPVEPPVENLGFDTAFEAITALTFGPDGTLYIGDSGTGLVHALTPPAVENPGLGQPYNLPAIDQTVAELIGTTRDQVRVRDLAVHPATTEAYVAVAVASGDTLQSAVVIVDQSGSARILEAAETTAVELPFAPTGGFSFYDSFPSRDLSITDLAVHDGRLYAAGMSNADFASSMWAVPIPFDGQPSVATVEMYHGVHGQMETRAPIRTMTITEIDGEAFVLAAYTCTPLVAFPVSAIEDGAHITGKTIAELGFGNTPGDIVAFDTQDMMGNAVSMLFIQNKNQSAQVIPMPAVAAAIGQPGIEAPLGLSTVDLGALWAPMTGILQVDEQDPGRLLTIRRDAESGDLEMMSYLKNVYFRLSDFQSEYEVPGYVFPPEQEQTKQFQNRMKVDEGYPQFVVE